MFRPTLTLLLALSFAGSAWADARQDLHAAMLRGLALKSFRLVTVDLTRNRTMSTVEFQAPDRFRISPMGMPPSLVIGDTMYLNHDGKSMKMPMPKGALGKFRNEEAIAAMEKGALVESLGPGMVGAEPASRYRFISHTATADASSEVWVGVRSGLVLQIESSGKNAGRPFAMRATYSDFNSPSIRIVAPN